MTILINLFYARPPVENLIPTAIRAKFSNQYKAYYHHQQQQLLLLPLLYSFVNAK